MAEEKLLQTQTRAGRRDIGKQHPPQHPARRGIHPIAIVAIFFGNVVILTAVSVIGPHFELWVLFFATSFNQVFLAK